jgi:hypothetical protein
MEKIIRDNYVIYSKTFEINGEKKVVSIRGDKYATPEIEEIIEKELDYQIYKKQQKALPIEQRDGTNTPTDFTCPICLAKDKTLIIKAPKIGTYTSGIWYARKRYTTVNLQNVYKCQNCKNQFTEEELNAKRLETSQLNQRVILFEQLKDEIITKEVYDDKLFEVRAGMTKQQYEAKRERKKKEYNSFGNRLFNSIGVIYQPKNLIPTIIAVIVVLLILSTIFPEYNPCKKFGDDWEYSNGSSGIRSACINSNGDIKYIKL